MKKSRDFFQRLAGRIRNSISNPDFDRVFWDKFEKEFGTRNKPNFVLSFFDSCSSQFQNFLPLTAAAGLFLAVGLFALLPKESAKINDLMSFNLSIEGVEIAQDLDLFEEMDSEEWILTASDEEWEELLNENES